jgi:hypothetical protein
VYGNDASVCFFWSRMDPKQKVAQEKDAKRFEPVEIQPSRLFQWAGQSGKQVCDCSSIINACLLLLL